MFCARVARSTANLSLVRVANGQGRGTLYCYRFTRHAYLTPAFLFPLSNSVSLAPSAPSLCFSGQHSLRSPANLTTALPFSYIPLSTSCIASTYLSRFNFRASIHTMVTYAVTRETNYIDSHNPERMRLNRGC